MIKAHEGQVIVTVNPPIKESKNARDTRQGKRDHRTNPQNLNERIEFSQAPRKILSQQWQKKGRRRNFQARNIFTATRRLDLIPVHFSSGISPFPSTDTLRSTNFASFGAHSFPFTSLSFSLEDNPRCPGVSRLGIDRYHSLLHSLPSTATLCHPSQRYGAHRRGKECRRNREK